MNTFESLVIRIGDLERHLSSETSRGLLNRVYGEQLSRYSTQLAG